MEENDPENDNNYEDNDDENMDEEDDEMMNSNYKNKNSNGVKSEDKEKMAPNIQIKPPGTKQKRRSKNETSGRDFSCGCGKTYLSYPALYTHIKTKHNGKTPEGTNANQLQDGRGRGRPRKNFLINEDSSIRANKDDYLEEKNSEIKDFYKRFNNDIDDDPEETKEVFTQTYKNLGLLGGPVSPFEGFPNFTVCSDYSKRSYEPLLTKIQYQFENNISISFSKTNIDYQNQIDDIEKKSKTVICDDIFAQFLIENSKVVSTSFYKTMLIFIRYYRECMNKLGWECIKNYKDLDDESTAEDFCLVKNGEHLPEIANDFLETYLPIKCENFNKELAIILVNHFCDWLFTNGFTHIKLTKSTV